MSGVGVEARGEIRSRLAAAISARSRAPAARRRWPRWGVDSKRLETVTVTDGRYGQPPAADRRRVPGQTGVTQDNQESPSLAYACASRVVQKFPN